MPSYASAGAWHCNQGPPCDPVFRGLFPGGGKRDRLARVGDRGAWIGSHASAAGDWWVLRQVGPCPQRRHAQALRGFGHGAPSAQGLDGKAGQPRQHPSTAGALLGRSMGLPGSLCGPHICDSNPPTHDVQVALGGPRRCHPSLPWHVNRQDDEKASGQEPSRRNLEEPRPDTHLRASCMTPRSPQLPPHPFVSFCRCASLALPCSPGPCCLSAWPLLSASLALALPVWLLPCLPGPCLAHQAPAVCQPGLCPACLAPAVCQPGPCPACLASALPAWPLPCSPGPCPAHQAPALPTWPLLSASLARALPARPLLPARGLLGL